MKSYIPPPFNPEYCNNFYDIAKAVRDIYSYYLDECVLSTTYVKDCMSRTQCNWIYCIDLFVSTYVLLHYILVLRLQCITKDLHRNKTLCEVYKNEILHTILYALPMRSTVFDSDNFTHFLYNVFWTLLCSDVGDIQVNGHELSQ